MKKEQAEEFTQSLGQIFTGSWRQIVLAEDLGVPKALGLTLEQWVKQRIGGYVKLSVDERREAVKELTEQGKTQREIAGVLGVDHSTVHHDLKSGENSPKEPAELRFDGENSTDLKKEDYKDKRREKEQTPRVYPISINHDIRLGDFREVLSDIHQADLIITDPPYPKEDLSLYSDLAKFAKRALGERGILFVWTGQLFLPQILQMLGEHLTYGWTFCLELPGAGSRIMGRHVIQAWKPILAYTRTTWPSGEWGDDKLISPSREKTRYEWEQNSEPAKRLIERYSPPNGLIVDPFTGVGSFSVAATAAGRKFIGAEINEGRRQKAIERLVEE